MDINSHSLGAHVTFEALRDASTNVVRYAWNFASAVDNEPGKAQPGNWGRVALAWDTKASRLGAVN